MVRNTLLILTIIICMSFNLTSSLKILGVFPHPGKSHFKVFEPLLLELARKGHELTVISPFPQAHPVPGYKDVSLEKESKLMLSFFDLELFQKTIFRYYLSPLIIASVAEGICEKLTTKPMQEFLKNEEKYDLIITEIFANDCFMGFIHKYKVPFIGMSSAMMMPFSNNFFGNPVNPSYIPIPFHRFSDRMLFLERLENTFYYLYSELMYKLLVERPSYEAAKNYFGQDLPPLSEIQKNMSLILLNTHFSYNLPRPYVPNVIEVGGLFIGKPKKLPDNIEKYITASKHGVIYFSMGSMINGASAPEEKRTAFINSFSKLKQRVVWKYENESMPNQPENVMIQKWMPQYDILCHPNVVAFISHGGMLGTSEAIQCGVPIIVIPQFADQFFNAKCLEIKGVGVKLELDNVTEETITTAINKVLQPKVQKRAKQFSVEFRDRPQDPLQTAVYWVEYVGRHQGAPHMRSAATDMPFYQYLLLDVIAFLLAIFLAIILINYYILKFLFRRIFEEKLQEKIKHKKN